MTTVPTTKDDTRDRYIESLRDLAHFLETHPEIPAGVGHAYMCYVVDSTAAVDAAAAVFGVEATVRDTESKHYTATINFDGLHYGIVWIPPKDDAAPVDELVDQADAEPAAAVNLHGADMHPQPGDEPAAPVPAGVEGIPVGRHSAPPATVRDRLAREFARHLHAREVDAAGLVGLIGELVDDAVRDHGETDPHIYPDGSTY